MPKGKNLGEILCSQLKEVRIEFVSVLDTRGFTNSIRIGKTQFLVKYANRSANRHWFGFSVKDVNSKKYSFALLLIGSNDIENIYAVPHNILSRFLRQGKPVWVGNSNYEQYEATIFPKRNYIMKVEHWPDDEFEVQTYQVHLIKDYFSSFKEPDITLQSS